MKEISIERMEVINGGKNNCSNLGNGLAIASLNVAMISLAVGSGPVGWGLLGLGLAFGAVSACQLGYA